MFWFFGWFLLMLTLNEIYKELREIRKKNYKSNALL